MMMFLQFFVWGAWYVTLGLVMSRQGLEARIGDAYSVGPAASILASLGLGVLADRFFASQKLLALLHGVGAVVLWTVPKLLLTQNSSGFLFALFVYMLCYMPTLALSNN